MNFSGNVYIRAKELRPHIPTTTTIYVCLCHMTHREIRDLGQGHTSSKGVRLSAFRPSLWGSRRTELLHHEKQNPNVSRVNLGRVFYVLKIFKRYGDGLQSCSLRGRTPAGGALMTTALFALLTVTGLSSFSLTLPVFYTLYLLCYLSLII